MQANQIQFCISELHTLIIAIIILTLQIRQVIKRKHPSPTHTFNTLTTEKTLFVQLFDNMKNEKIYPPFLSIQGIEGMRHLVSPSSEELSSSLMHRVVFRVRSAGADPVGVITAWHYVLVIISWIPCLRKLFRLLK